MPHPNRNKKGDPGSNPRPEQVRAAREAAGLTQTEAGALVYVTLNGWQKWEAGERPMHPAFWALFRLRLKLITLLDL